MTKETFLLKLSELVSEVNEGKLAVEPTDVSKYLENIGNWIQDSDGYQNNTDQDFILSDENLKSLYQVLVAGLVYE